MSTRKEIPINLFRFGSSITESDKRLLDLSCELVVKYCNAFYSQFSYEQNVLRAARRVAKNLK